MSTWRGWCLCLVILCLSVGWSVAASAKPLSSAERVAMMEDIVTLMRQGDIASARSTCETLLEDLQSDKRKTPMTTASILLLLGKLELAAGELEAGEAHYLEAKALVDPLGPIASRVKCQVLIALGELSYLQGDPEQARRQLEGAVKMAKDLGGKVEQSLPSALVTLGDIYRESGEFELAAEQFQECLDLYATGETSIIPELNLRALLGLAMTRAYQDDYSTAEELLDEVDRVLEASEVPNDLMQIQALQSRAMVLAFQGRFSEAIPLLEETLPEAERMLGAESPLTLLAQLLLGFSYCVEGQFELGEPLMDTSLAQRQAFYGETHAEYGVALELHGLMRVMQGDLETGEAEIKEAERIVGEGLSEDSFILKMIRDTYDDLFGLPEDLDE